MTIATFIGGRYSSTLAAADMGITEDGYQLILAPHGERIERSDAYGDSLLDYFVRGVNASIVLDGLEYKGTAGTSGPLGSVWPWGTTFGTYGTVGRLASAIAMSLVMTATAGTPAASTPATLTAARSIVDPGFNITLLFTSRLRKIPMRFACLPSDSFVHFTTS